MRATARGARVVVDRPGIVAITSGNYGGELGPFHIRLRDVPARH